MFIYSHTLLRCVPPIFMPIVIFLELGYFSTAPCQLFKFDLISALLNSIFDMIGLARTSQEYH